VTTAPTTAAAYIRKSNDQQDRTEEVKSVATQRDLVTTFAAARGWTLDDKHIYADDGITGALFAERPGLQALLAATRTTPVPFTKLIIVEQSRLGRDQIDTMVLIRDIEESGVEIWSTRDGRRITLSDDTSKLLASLEGWRDESERKKTATRVHDAAKTRFERGYVVGGRVHGYKNERLPGVKGPRGSSSTRSRPRSCAASSACRRRARPVSHRAAAQRRGPPGSATSQRSRL
jgi:site-specific DNA recombinase